MSSLSSAELPTIAGQITTTLLPNVRKIDTHDDSNTLSIIIAVSIVFILSPVTISSNTLILAAFYRFKRLRTASNWLLASLAVSDFGVKRYYQLLNYCLIKSLDNRNKKF